MPKNDHFLTFFCKKNQRPYNFLQKSGRSIFCKKNQKNALLGRIFPFFPPFAWSSSINSALKKICRRPEGPEAAKAFFYIGRRSRPPRRPPRRPRARSHFSKKSIFLIFSIFFDFCTIWPHFSIFRPFGAPGLVPTPSPGIEVYFEFL